MVPLIVGNPQVGARSAPDPDAFLGFRVIFALALPIVLCKCADGFEIRRL